MRSTHPMKCEKCNSYNMYVKNSEARAFDVRRHLEGNVIGESEYRIRRLDVENKLDLWRSKMLRIYKVTRVFWCDFILQDGIKFRQETNIQISVIRNKGKDFFIKNLNKWIALLNWVINFLNLKCFFLAFFSRYLNN